MRSGGSKNLLLNPRHAIRSYGTTGFTTTSGFVTDRWRYTDAVGVTCAPGTTPAVLATNKKALESTTCLNVPVIASTYPGTGSIVRQRVEFGGVMGLEVMRLCGIAFGPVGGSFEYGLSGGGMADHFKICYTQGPTVPVTFGVDEPIYVPLLSTTYLTATIFQNPADIDGTYQLAYSQLDYLEDGLPPASLEFFRPIAYDQYHCRRYAHPVGYGQYGASSTTTFNMAVEFDPPMRDVPTIVSPAAACDFRNLRSAATLSTVAATISLDGATERGAKVIVDGFSGLSALDGKLMTDPVCVLEAELG